MSQENTNENKKCGKKSKVMFAYGLIQLGSSLISAIALAAIAISFCSITQKANIFNECVEELTKAGESSSAAVHYCEGGD